MISVVYYGYIKIDSAWSKIIYGQMHDLVATGLCKIANIYINLTCEDLNTAEKCKSYILQIIPKASISLSYVNQFEYPGIHKVWELAQKHPDKNHIIFYFHSKGMSYNEQNRSWQEIVLFKNTIYIWAKIIDIFLEQSDINKIGLVPSEQGAIWFNFWGVRASYVNEQLVEPIITQDRFYYESWLINKFNQNSNDCFDLSKNKKGTCGDASYAISVLQNYINASKFSN